MDPTATLRDVWTELERRFGNPAAITNVLLERLRKAAKFGEGDKDKLQAFADICSDVDNQLDFLPGLGCLNYITSIGPIVKNLPTSLRSKWEKDVVKYAESHYDANPGFKDFAAMVREQAKQKNHPNVQAGASLSLEKNKTSTSGHTPRHQNTPRANLEPDRRVLKSSATNVESRNAP